MFGFRRESDFGQWECDLSVLLFPPFHGECVKVDVVLEHDK
jgi:hypothetical protein